MKAVIQYVTQAKVEILSHPISEIKKGYLILVGFSSHDNSQKLTSMAKKIISLRTIPDQNQKINLSIKDIDGQILLIPQFTLYADTSRGHRPSFSQAASSTQGRELFDHFTHLLSSLYPHVLTGVFQSHMQVKLTNSGPITLILEN